MKWSCIFYMIERFVEEFNKKKKSICKNKIPEMPIADELVTLKRNGRTGSVETTGIRGAGMLDRESCHGIEKHTAH